MRKLTLLAAALLIAIGCSGPSQPDIPGVTGSWAGHGAGVAFDLTLVEDQETQELAGSGELLTVPPPVLVSVTGAHRHPDVELVLTAPGWDITFVGVLENDDLIVGRATEATFAEYALRLYRQ